MTRSNNTQKILLATLLATLTIGPCVHAQSTSYRGFIRPSKHVVLSAPLDGVLETIAVEENDAVTKGQILAHMDSKIQEARVAAATIQADYGPQIRSAELSLELTNIRLERTKTLFEKGAAKELEVKEREVERDQSQAQLDASHMQKQFNLADLKREQETLARYEIKAPFDGIVRRRIVEAGSTLSNGDQMLEMVKLDPLEAEINLPINLMGHIEEGKTYTIVAEQDIQNLLNKTDFVKDGKLTAVLKTIDRVIDPSSGTFRCVFTIDNPESQLPGGFSVDFAWPQ